MLDKISIKILDELSRNARISNIEIAKKTGVSVATVARKINYFIENDIITIKARPNPILEGYYSQAFIGLSVELNKIEKICNTIKKNIHVRMLTTSFGRFNILMIVMFNTDDQFQDFIKNKLPNIDGIYYIKTYVIASDLKFLKNIKDNKRTDLQESNIIRIDEINQKIINELIKDGRSNSASLAKKLGVSTPTIARRISTLLKEHVIEIRAFANFTKIGYLANACLMVNVNYDQIGKICKKLSDFSEVFFMIILKNDYDIIIGVRTYDFRKLTDFLKNVIGKIEGIQQTESFILGEQSWILFYY